MPIRVTVFGENVHEHVNKIVAKHYPNGMHTQIAAQLSKDANLSVSTVTLQEPQHGLTQEKLDATDVLTWWGHRAHDQVDDAVVERVAKRVHEGMGLIVLHSGHFSKIFKRLMGTPCDLRWREAGERERLWVVNPGHPIARDLPDHFELEMEEMYGEPFGVPEPLETIFSSWFQGGETFRSGLTYRRGAGSIFYFRPGHETYPTYHDEHVGLVLRNAVNWAYNPRRYDAQPPVSNRKEALEPLTIRGESSHGPDEN
jgi:trehalose utilization protein